MAYSYYSTVAPGGVAVFNFSFPYINVAHLHAYVDGVEVGYTLTGPYQVTLDATPAADQVVKVARETPTTPLVDYQDASTLSEADLDTAFAQSLYLTLEAVDFAESALNVLGDGSGNFDAGSRKIVNLADPENAQDAATMAWVAATYATAVAAAAASAAAALVSENAAAASETAAAVSEAAAAASAAAAAASAAAAAASETNAAASETAAAASQAAAAASQSAAAASQSAAAASAAAASVSETNAAASAAAALVSEGNAAASETAAGISETNAAASETAAGASEIAAALSEANSAASEAVCAAAADSIGWNDVVFLTSASSPYTVTDANRGNLLAVDCTGGNVIINLPSVAVATMPFALGVKKTDGTANTITVNPNGTDTIDGLTSDTISDQGATKTYAGDTDPTPDIWTSISYGGGGGGIAKVSANDTTPGYFNGKLVVGTGIEFTENNDGGNETLSIGFKSDGHTTGSVPLNTEGQVYPTAMTTTYAKVAECNVMRSGTVNVRISINKSSDGKVGNAVGYGKIYVNGSAVGTQRSVTNPSGQTYWNEDVTVNAGDLVQLYCKTSNNAYPYMNYASLQVRAATFILGEASGVKSYV